MVEEPSKPTSRVAGVDAHSVDHSRDIYTAANVITLLRLVLVPIAFAVLISGRNDNLAFVLFALAASTDWLDGQIARRTGTVTVIGKAIDPLVDRFLLAAGVVGLYLVDRLPAWVMVVLVLRDVYLLYGAWRLEHEYNRRLAVTFLGKLTTATLLVGFADLILGWPMVPGLGLVDLEWLPGFGSTPVILGTWFVYLGVVFSLVSAGQYTIAAFQLARQAKGAESAGSGS